MALHLRGQELSLRDIASRLVVIAKGKKKGQHPGPRRLSGVRVGVTVTRIRTPPPCPLQPKVAPPATTG
jgi:hypothetical protein